MSEQTDLPAEEEVDLYEITDLDEQKTHAQKMLDIVSGYQRHFKQKFKCVQTVDDIVDAQVELKLELGEYLGYLYGSINEVFRTLETSAFHLGKFVDGDFDKLDPNARSMYINLWYNIGISNVDVLDSFVEELEGIEGDLIQQIRESAADGFELEDDEESSVYSKVKGMIH